MVLPRSMIKYAASTYGNIQDAFVKLTTPGVGMEEKNALESESNTATYITENAEVEYQKRRRKLALEQMAKEIAHKTELDQLNADLEEKCFQLEIENEKNVKLQEENQRLIENQKGTKNAHLGKLQKINAERFKERSQNDAEVKKLQKDYQKLIEKQKVESEESSTHGSENSATMYISGTNKPSMKLLNKPYVRNKIAIVWEYLGLELLDEKHCVMLEVIKQNHEDVRVCCTQMLRYWLEVDTKASWNVLIKALEEIHQDSLAMYIKASILKVTLPVTDAALNENDTDKHDDSVELAMLPLVPQQSSDDAKHVKRKIKCCLLM